MESQNYLIIQNNVVTNIVLWNNDPNTWQPPADSLQLVQITTAANVWDPVKVDGKIVDWVLTSTVGAGDIGFTWDGSVLTTNQPKPSIPTN
jgi:hypothetical protein